MKICKRCFQCCTGFLFTVRMTAYFPLMIQLCIDLTKTMNFASRHLPLKDKEGQQIRTDERKGQINYSVVQGSSCFAT